MQRAACAAVTRKHVLSKYVLSIHVRHGLKYITCGTEMMNININDLQLLTDLGPVPSLPEISTHHPTIDQTG